MHDSSCPAALGTEGEDKGPSGAEQVPMGCQKIRAKGLQPCKRTSAACRCAAENLSASALQGTMRRTAVATAFMRPG